MEPRVITQYQTSDGNTFSSWKKACDHEYDIQGEKLQTAFDVVLSMIEQHRPSSDEMGRCENRELAQRIVYSQQLKNVLDNLDSGYLESRFSCSEQERFAHLEQEIKDEYL